MYSMTHPIVHGVHPNYESQNHMPIVIRLRNYDYLVNFLDNALSPILKNDCNPSIDK